MPWGQGQEMTLTFHTFISSVSCLHLPTFRSQASIVSEKSTVLNFSYRKACHQIWSCLKIGQGLPRVIIWINYDGLEFQMLDTKVRGNRFTSSGEEDVWRGFTIYGHGDHLGHVTSIIFMNFHFIVPESLLKMASSFLGKQVLISMCKCPGAKVKNWPWPSITSLAQLVVCLYQLSGHRLQ